ncbi:hypothetical protein GCM10023335_43170 [Streptomyces siamensis]|uniref:Uncharacterized protein n=1 Tax=Streptomyces siamensis TaxID=1274986 RepID=A0ABP9J2P5_9ACTN
MLVPAGAGDRAEGLVGDVPGERVTDGPGQVRTHPARAATLWPAVTTPDTGENATNQ